ncbi:MAG: ATP synthase F1 subunit gamma [bacterium]|nr:ATP synthase F1 subunit gamma [bacterium]
MATQRDIKNRISSITNTKKITSTMEMVATAKMKKQQGRLEMSKPYELKVNEIIANLMASDVGSSGNPLFTEVDNPSKALILMITGNRGLCGSYNTNVIDNSLALKEKLIGEGVEALNYVVGKKGINYMNFMKESMFKTLENPDDKFSFEEAAKIGTELQELFLTGEVHEVYISYTKVLSSSSQKPAILKLLPISPSMEGEHHESMDLEPANYIFEPNPAKIFSYILPLYLKVKIFTCFLESSFSEQFARRVAMKNATDASGEMIKELTVTYNRARQAKITNEIAEICGGAAALE